MLTLERMLKQKEYEYLNLKNIAKSEQPFELNDPSILRLEDGYSIPESFWSTIQTWNDNFVNLASEIEHNINKYRVFFRPVTSKKKYLIPEDFVLNPNKKEKIGLVKEHYKLSIDNIYFIIEVSTYYDEKGAEDRKSYNILQASFRVSDNVRLRLTKTDITVFKGDYRFTFNTGLDGPYENVYFLEHLNKKIKYLFVKNKMFVLDSEETDESGYTEIDREHLTLGNFKVMKQPYVFDLNKQPVAYQYKVNFNNTFLRFLIVSDEMNQLLEDARVTNNSFSIWTKIFITSITKKLDNSSFIERLNARETAKKDFFKLINKDFENNKTWQTIVPVSDSFIDIFEHFLSSQEMMKDLYSLSLKV